MGTFHHFSHIFSDYNTTKGTAYRERGEKTTTTNIILLKFSLLLLLGFLNDIQCHAGCIDCGSIELFFLLTFFVAVGVLIDQEKQHKQEQSLGEEIARGLVDELQVEHVFRRNDRQCLWIWRRDRGKSLFHSAVVFWTQLQLEQKKNNNKNSS